MDRAFIVVLEAILSLLRVCSATHIPEPHDIRDSIRRELDLLMHNIVPELSGYADGQAVDVAQTLWVSNSTIGVLALRMTRFNSTILGSRCTSQYNVNGTH